MARPWYVAPALDTLRDQINADHPGRDRSSDGAIGDAAHAARKSDHNPDPKTRVVRARDFDVDGIPVGPILAALERDQRTGLLIYDHRYWTRGHGWRPYSGINPHTGHFHISVRHGTQYENDTSAWPLAPQEEDAMTPELAARLDQIVAWLDGRINDLARLENANRDALATFTRKAVTDAVKTVPGVDPTVVENAVEKAFTDAIDSIERTTTTVTTKGASS